MPFPTSDHAELREQYADDANLGARRNIYSYGQDADLPSTVIALAGLTDRERVIDIGCGPGTYLAAIRSGGHRGSLIAVDLSPGMLSTTRDRGLDLTPVNADVNHLPLADGSSHVTIAAHMLYHASDIPAAIRELRRITAPGGRVLVVLNGRNHLRELRRLSDQTHERVTVESAEPLLRDVFDEVAITVLRGELAVPIVAPILDYAASFPRDTGLSQVELAVEVQRQIELTGAFRDTVEPGILVCR